MDSRLGLKLLIPEQADALRQTELHLAFVTHGQLYNSRRLGEYVRGSGEEDYDLARASAEALDASNNDVFVQESYGYTERYSYIEPGDIVRQIDDKIPRNALAPYIRASHTGQYSIDTALEVARQARLVGPVGYALGYAVRSGVSIARADADKYSKEAFEDIVREIPPVVRVLAGISAEGSASMYYRDNCIVSGLGAIALDVVQGSGIGRPRLLYMAGSGHMPGIMRRLALYDITPDSVQCAGGLASETALAAASVRSAFWGWRQRHQLERHLTRLQRHHESP